MGGIALAAAVAAEVEQLAGEATLRQCDVAGVHGDSLGAVGSGCVAVFGEVPRYAGLSLYRRTKLSIPENAAETGAITIILASTISPPGNPLGVVNADANQATTGTTLATKARKPARRRNQLPTEPAIRQHERSGLGLDCVHGCVAVCVKPSDLEVPVLEYMC